jgi:putative membrane protein
MTQIKRLAVAAVAAALLAAATTTQADARSSPRSLTSNAMALDRTWLGTITQADLAEIALGRLAADKGTSAGVKSLAARLVSDHTKDLAKVRTLARRGRIQLTKQPSPLQGWAVAALRSLSGTTFDEQWAAAQVAAHLEAIAATRGEIRDGRSASVRARARATLPMLKAHLKLAQALPGGGG